jgi:hypothetical protein
VAECGDLFGWAIAAGDFDRDGFDDLAVGVPGEDLGGIADAGEVDVFYGRYILGFDRTQVFNQDGEGVPDRVEAGDSFGRSLTAADFNGDGLFDLAIGAPFEDVGPYFDAGAVTVLNGEWHGIFPNGGNQLLTGALQTGAKFGGALNGSVYFNDATGPGGVVLTLTNRGSEPPSRLLRPRPQRPLEEAGHMRLLLAGTAPASSVGAAEKCSCAATCAQRSRLSTRRSVKGDYGLLS